MHMFTVPHTIGIVCLRAVNVIYSLLDIVIKIHWDCFNIGYHLETHLKPKSLKISFACNIHISCRIILEFCTVHGSIIAMLCEKFQNDLTAKI